MERNAGWIPFKLSPPFIFTGIVFEPLYTAVELRREGDPEDAEPEVITVSDLLAPANDDLDPEGLLWKPVI